MKKEYQSPEMNVLMLEDVIVTSDKNQTEITNPNPDNSGEVGNGWGG